MMFMVMKSPTSSLTCCITARLSPYNHFFFFNFNIDPLKGGVFILKFLVICLFVFANPSRYLIV
jgi:hypothetical protein